jgi:D-alanyl-D-alanine carboxypeptidase
LLKIKTSVSNTIVSSYGVKSNTLALEEFLNFNDLLYGMMLPSGNDTAQSIADYFL